MISATLLLIIGVMGQFDSSHGAVCTAAGDPHYTTFDNSRISFQGNCQYILSELCPDHQLNPIASFQWKVSSQNKAHTTSGGKTVSMVDDVTVSFGGIVNKAYTMQTNGKIKLTTGTGSTEHTLPFTDPTVSIALTGSVYKLTTGFGLAVEFDHSKHHVKVELSADDFKGKLCGVCGNWNDNPTDDRIPNGKTVVGSDDEIGNSWKIVNSPCL